MTATATEAPTVDLATTPPAVHKGPRQPKGSKDTKPRKAKAKKDITAVDNRENKGGQKQKAAAIEEALATAM